MSLSRQHDGGAATTAALHARCAPSTAPCPARRRRRRFVGLERVCAALLQSASGGFEPLSHCAARRARLPRARRPASRRAVPARVDTAIRLPSSVTISRLRLGKKRAASSTMPARHDHHHPMGRHVAQHARMPLRRGRSPGRAWTMGAEGRFRRHFDAVPSDRPGSPPGGGGLRQAPLGGRSCRHSARGLRIAHHVVGLPSGAERLVRRVPPTGRGCTAWPARARPSESRRRPALARNAERLVWSVR